MRHCKYHCAVCDAHFTSLSAFDAHHRVTTSMNAQGARDRYTTCLVVPKNTPKTEWVAVEGVCSLTKGSIGAKLPCMIWRDSVSDTRFNSEIPQGPMINDSAGVGVIPPLSDIVSSETFGRKPTAVLCRVCREPIPPSGRRGRPRLTHAECVPT